jgi:hypothetical protein
VGTWNGKVIFQEPMVTRDFILSTRDGADSEIAYAVPSATRYEPAGLYPRAAGSAGTPAGASSGSR